MGVGRAAVGVVTAECGCGLDQVGVVRAESVWAVLVWVWSRPVFQYQD